MVVGLKVGWGVGEAVGKGVGLVVGCGVGLYETVGDGVGDGEGMKVGWGVGEAVGIDDIVGLKVGYSVAAQEQVAYCDPPLGTAPK